MKATLERPQMTVEVTRAHREAAARARWPWAYGNGEPLAGWLQSWVNQTGDFTGSDGAVLLAIANAIANAEHGEEVRALRKQLELWRHKIEGWFLLLRMAGNMAEREGKAQAATAYRDVLTEAQDSFSRLLHNEAESLGPPEPPAATDPKPSEKP